MIETSNVPPPQVIDDDLAIALLGLVRPKASGRGRLVDDALDFQAGDAAGVLGGLALAVVEVRRHRDHGLGDFLAQVVLGGLLHLAQHFGRHLGRRQFLPRTSTHASPLSALTIEYGIRSMSFWTASSNLRPDQALDRVQGVLGVGDRLALGPRADQRLAIVHVGDDGGVVQGAFGVLDDLDLTAVQDSHAAVGRTQVDANDFAHGGKYLAMN